MIDIGSNSVRQVIYEGLTRAPSILFNEKILCGLGEEVARTGRMADEAVARATTAIHRFTALGRQAGVGSTHVLATAAVREAKNGKAFIRKVEDACNSKVIVLSGKSEAEYAALGVKSGFHKPKGIVGDLGGGSLELIGINGQSKGGVSLPLGGLHLKEMSGGEPVVASRIVKKTLKKVPLEWPDNSRVFYAVGGTWRSLVRLHMTQVRYPLHVVHDYRVDAVRFRRFCRKIMKSGVDNVKGIEEISKNRRALIPYGAAVMEGVLSKLGAEEITASSMGLREGFLYSLLDDEERQKDGLLEAARELSILRSRSPKHCEELIEWTNSAFATLGIEESANEKRYRLASCFLSDIAWRVNSDYRAEQSIGIISNAGFGGIDHAGRAYLAIANFHRHQGMGSKSSQPAIAKLAPQRLAERARLLAAMFRVLSLFSASVSGVLPDLKLKKTGKTSFQILVPPKLAKLVGERIESRVDQLARETDCDIRLKITD